VVSRWRDKGVHQLVHAFVVWSIGAAVRGHGVGRQDRVVGAQSVLHETNLSERLRRFDLLAAHVAEYAAAILVEISLQLSGWRP